MQDTGAEEKVVSFEWLHYTPLHFLIITDLINLFCLYNTFCNNLSSSPFFREEEKNLYNIVSLKNIRYMEDRTATKILWLIS